MGHNVEAKVLYPTPIIPMAMYAKICDDCKTRRQCAINVQTQAKNTHATFLPVISLTKPEIGARIAVIKLGRPGIKYIRKRVLIRL